MNPIAHFTRNDDGTITQNIFPEEIAWMPKPEWRVIEDYPEYEITADGIVRNRETKVRRSTKNGRNVPDRFKANNPNPDGAKYILVNVRKVRNKAFPELYPW